MPQHPIGFRGTEVERFWSKVKINYETGCWEWQAARGPLGYGSFSLALEYSGAVPVHVRAHRWAYEYCVGPIPDGKELHHKCEIPSCVRPDHLMPVTDAEHVLLGNSPASKHARQVTCIRGHNNWRILSSGSRQCRDCAKIHKQKRLKGERTAEGRKADGIKAWKTRRTNVPLVLFGKPVTLGELSRLSGITFQTLHRRIRTLGMSVEEAMTTGPIKSGPKPKTRKEKP